MHSKQIAVQRTGRLKRCGCKMPNEKTVGARRLSTLFLNGDRGKSHNEEFQEGNGIKRDGLKKWPMRVRHWPLQTTTYRAQSQSVRKASYIMPPMPPMPPISGIAGAALSSGMSATIASVVIIRPPMDAAACSAERVTFAGSRIPISIMSP